MSTPATPVLPKETYALLVGLIEQPMLQRIAAGLSNASMNGVETMHVLFQSTGGGIGEGVCFYNLLQTLPIEVTLYNTGVVSSTALIAYLGAKHRKTSRYATFMIHRTQTTTQWATTATIQTLAQSAILFDKNSEAILRKHINMPAEKWTCFDHNDLWFSAEEAVKFGIAEEIGEFSPPVGTKLYYL